MPVIHCLVCTKAFQGKSRNKYCSTVCYHQSTVTPLAERFWSYVLKTDTCWLWQGGLGSRGYGAFSLNSTQQVRAHRLSYELTYGMILPGLLCLHRCDTPACVRPDHLFLGTSRDNALDMYSKKRSGFHVHPESYASDVRNKTNNPRGEQHHSTTLTEIQVREIRALYATGTFSQKQIAAMFGIGQATVARIVNRQSWQHIS